MTNSTKPKPAFKKVLSGIKGGEILIPVIEAYLHDPSFPSFDVHVHGVEYRPPDGWFHPSTHPLWTERQLYYYLTEPEGMSVEMFDPLSTMAITAGNFWHSFMQVCLIDAGILKGVEVPLEDPEVGSRGSMDGDLGDGGWEYKTMNSMRMRLIPKGAPNSPEVIEGWKKMAPDYCSQAYEYMRMSGYRTMRFIIQDTGYPFPMREILLPYDAKAALEVRDKYARVRQAVADQRPPSPCCAPLSKEAKVCPAREVCPIGRA